MRRGEGGREKVSPGDGGAGSGYVISRNSEGRGVSSLVSTVGDGVHGSYVKGWCQETLRVEKGKELIHYE